MRDILPEHLFKSLRDRYLAGVADAEDRYHMSAADEDALTGALGQSISTPSVTRFLDDNGSVFDVRIDYVKLRGRGTNAPEKLYGSDGIFQMKVADSRGKVIRSKGLPFQSKKNWAGKDTRLLSQAKLMNGLNSQSIVVDFRESAYTACLSTDVIEAEGDNRIVRENKKLKTLGHILADDFLSCNIGTLNLFFDPKDELYKIDGGTFHIISTVVRVKR